MPQHQHQLLMRLLMLQTPKSAHVLMKLKTVLTKAMQSKNQKHRILAPQKMQWSQQEQH